MFYKSQLDWLTVLFNMSTLTIFPLVLPITGKEILKFLSIIADLSILPFNSISFGFMYFEVMMLGARHFF